MLRAARVFRRFLARLEALEPRWLPASFDGSGAALLMDLSAGEQVSVAAGAADYSLVLASGSWTGANVAGKVAAAGGTLTVTRDQFASIRLTDSGDGAKVTFADSEANAYSDPFDVVLDGGSGASAGVVFNGATSCLGSDGLSVETDRSILLDVGASVKTVDGAILLTANQQAMATNGSFLGVFIDAATLEATGAGTVTVRGRGGDAGADRRGVGVSRGSLIRGSAVSVNGTGGAAAGINNWGVAVLHNSTITSGGGDVSVTGTGGGTGASGLNYGVYLELTGLITAGGNGTLSVNGTGGSASGGANHGVFAKDASSAITSGAGEIVVQGTGGSSVGGGNDNSGIRIANGAAVSLTGGSSQVTLTGTGGSSPGTGNDGILLDHGTVSSDGSIGMAGTEGAGTDRFGIRLTNAATVTTVPNGSAVVLSANSIDLGSDVAVSAHSGSAVAFLPRTSGTPVDLGGADAVGKLGLTDAELDRVAADRVVVGDLTTGAILITAPVSPALTPSLSLATGGGSITQAAGATLTVANFTFGGLGSVNLPESNAVGSLTGTFSTFGPNLTFTAAGDLAVSAGNTGNAPAHTAISAGGALTGSARGLASLSLVARTGIGTASSRFGVGGGPGSRRRPRPAASSWRAGPSASAA